MGDLMYHLDCFVAEHTLGNSVCVWERCAFQSVCVFALSVYPCDDNPVCDLVACGVAPLSFGGSLQVFCAKLEPGQRDQRVTYTSTASGQAASEHQ